MNAINHYDTFFRLHHQEKPFIIANAWNVKSAQLIEKTGYAAIATSSGAIANSLGYEDGEKIPFGELLYIIKRISACTTVPLSVDFERGYTNDLAELNDNIDKLIDAGAVGINLEDAQGEDAYLRKLHSIKTHLTKTNRQLFINARTDVFLQKLEAPLETTLKRAKAYADAGADGLFVPGMQDAEILKTITSSVSLPVNVVGVPKLSSIETIAECGVKRISMAVLPYKATYNRLESLLTEIKTEQSFSPLF